MVEKSLNLKKQRKNQLNSATLRKKTIKMEEIDKKKKFSSFRKCRENFLKLTNEKMKMSLNLKKFVIKSNITTKNGGRNDKI